MTELKPRKTLFNPELKRRGIYVLPNLFTTAALFAGFFAIVQAMQETSSGRRWPFSSPWYSTASTDAWRA